MNKEIKKLNVLKKKYLKALKELERFNDTIINLGDEEIGFLEIYLTQEFFDCEITLINMIKENISNLDSKIEEIQACNLTGLKPDFKNQIKGGIK